MEPLLFRWPGLFLLAAGQGIFLSISIFSLPKGNRKANRALAGIILIFSLNLIYYVGYWMDALTRVHSVFALVMQLIWLIGPLFYTYLRCVSGNPPKLESWAFHNLPFLLATLILIPVYFNWFEGYDWNSTYERVVSNGIPALQIIHLLIYYILIRNFRKNSASGITEQSNKNWLNKIPTYFLGFSLSFSSYYFLVWIGILRVEYDYIISALMSIFIYSTGYAGYKNPLIFKNQETKEKYEHSNLSQTASKEMMEKVNLYLLKYQPFINSDLKLPDLANDLGIKSHHLSQIINENQKENFSEYINRHRVNYAKKIMKSPNKQKMRIIDIAYDSGFNNKVSFLKAFKKFEGVTPSDYRNQNINDY